MATFHKISVDAPDALITRCIDTIRVVAADTVEKAKSGHPGAPMGCAPIAHVLFGEVMNFSPSNPRWYNRDRFVLSNGHACALLYTMLHLTGYDVSVDDLKNFRQLDSKTPGHPENFLTPGVEVSTGPLGQGISNAVGLAMAEKHLGAVYNRDNFNVIDHFTYVICGDGCLQEGVSAEASSLAGHLGLGKLIVCYDDNKITIDGDTSLSFTEDVGKRYESYGWQVLVVHDGNDVTELRSAIAAAKEEKNRPTLIKVRTVIGFGSKKQGTEAVHGAPLGTADLAAVKEKFHFDPKESFVVPQEVKEYYDSCSAEGVASESAWNTMFALYSQSFPALADEFVRRMKGQLPANWTEKMPKYTPQDKVVATRNRSEEVLNVMANVLPEFFGGSADLTPSNLTFLKCTGDFQHETPAGRYVRFGIREHAMAAICNGLFAYGGFRPFCATFLNFLGYAMGSFRLSALSRFGVLYVMTHDSIGLGEDGPTHQPVEIMDSIRCMPNCHLIRPADGNEVVGAYIQAMEHPEQPTVIVLSRQGTPTLAHSSAQSVSNGAYVMEDLRFSESDVAVSRTRPDLVLVSTGTEVALALDVGRSLLSSECAWIRVVSMPCQRLFENQSKDYQLSVFPAGSPVVSIEPSSTQSWYRWAHVPLGMERFGKSAPASDLYRVFGFTVSTLKGHCDEIVKFYGVKQENEDGFHSEMRGASTWAPSLIGRPHFAPSFAGNH